MPSARKFNALILLQGIVVLFAIFLLWVKWTNLGNLSYYDRELIEVTESERNERSTPRSFILPATPAVAYEQERQRAQSHESQRQDCLGVLRRLGYPLNNRDTPLSAKTVEVIYTFQIKHSLPATGRLDQATMAVMRCL